VSNIKQLIDKIQDSSSVLVDLPLKNGNHTRLLCVLKKTESPSFELLFPPDILQSFQIDTEAPCRLAVKQADKPITILAILNAFGEDQRSIQVTGKEPINPELLREYFRVSIRTSVRAAFEPVSGGLGRKSWSMDGETVDLSGGGLLANFPAAPSAHSGIRLEIDLPSSPDEPLVVIANVVRTYQLRKKRCQVAFHFDSIEQRLRDKIISCCLQEQRRQLREQIQTEQT
jgi:hypothetical protein